MSVSPCARPRHHHLLISRFGTAGTYLWTKLLFCGTAALATLVRGVGRTWLCGPSIHGFCLAPLNMVFRVEFEETTSRSDKIALRSLSGGLRMAQEDAGIRVHIGVVSAERLLRLYSVSVVVNLRQGPLP
jgi:hypothetical protein